MDVTALCNHMPACTWIFMMHCIKSEIQGPVICGTLPDVRI